MTYTKRLTTKITRTVHAVTLHAHTTALAIKSTLVSVPNAAKLIDEEEDKHGNTVLLFEEEKPEGEEE